MRGAVRGKTLVPSESSLKRVGLRRVPTDNDQLQGKGSLDTGPF